jgi:hypothetical protein
MVEWTRASTPRVNLTRQQGGHSLTTAMHKIALASLDHAGSARPRPRPMEAHMWIVELRRSDGSMIEQQANLSDYALRHWLRGYTPRNDEMLCLLSDDPHQIADMIRRMSIP